MKKPHLTFIYSFLIVLSIFAISGCASNEKDSGVKIDDYPLDRRIGSIVSLGTVTTSSRGTHLLRLDDGDTILLKSLSINLDDEKFKNEVVEVKGVLTYSTGDKPVMEVMNIDIMENHVAEASDAPKWKTWSGELFQINYRDDFKIEQNNNSIIFSRPVVKETVDGEVDGDNVVENDKKVENDEAEDIVSIVFEKKVEGKGLADKLGIDKGESSSLLDLGLVESKIGIQNIDAYRKGGQDDSILVYYTEDESNIYTISFEAGKKENRLKSENLFYEMLASFDLGSDFGEVSDDVISSRTLDVDAEDEEAAMESTTEVIDTVEIDNFTEYESDTFGFKVSYPKNWYFEGSAGVGSGVVRHYDFGKDPLDESSAEVGMDLLGSVPAGGKKVSYGGRELTKIVTGSVVEIYFEGEDRAYRFSGNSENESLLLQIASSLTEK